MKLKNLLFGILGCILLGACSDDDKTPIDADENFITSVSLSIGDETYDAVIADNTITVTVPYTVSLNGAKATFVYTPSAKIIPDPATITDWNVERTFRVTSFNGETNDYTYVVIKDEIRHEGNVELKTASDVTSFVASGVTIIKGDLIIGSDAENAEEINDISALEILKEVEGNIIIRQSYTGGTLTGLDNITSIGGLLIGSEEKPAANNQLEMVSMANLTSAKSDISIYGSGTGIIEFKKLETVGGSIVINNATKLSQISFSGLKEAGSIDFKILPRDFSTLTLPELTTVEGDLNIQGIFGDVHTGGLTIATGNTGLKSISGLDKLSKVGGTLSIQYFEELTSFPNFSKLEQIGGVYLTYNHKVSTFDISNTDIIGIDGAVGLIKLDNNRILTELKTKEDLSEVDVWLLSQGYTIKTNFSKVKNLFASLGTSEDIEFPNLKKVFGNFDLSSNSAAIGSIMLPLLSQVDGFMAVDVPNSKKMEMPIVENTGGQIYISLGSQAVVNMPKLTTVCNAENPQYKKGGVDVYGRLIGSLYLNISANVTLPAIETIYGDGLTLLSSRGFSAPLLKTIGGTLTVSSTKLTSNLLSLPLLESLSGLNFYKATKFDNFSAFAKFINDGQISEDYWSVKKCAYNPTWQDMKEGRYKPAE